MSTVAGEPLTPSASALEGVGKRYIRAAFYSGMAGVVSRVFQGLTPLILARYLGPKEFGVYALAISLVSTVAGISNLGQSSALQKFLPEYFVKDPSRGGAILVDTVLMTAGALAAICTVFYMFSGRIAADLYHDASLQGSFEFCAVLVLCVVLFQLASSVAAGLQDFKEYSWAMVVRSSVNFGLGWVGVAFFGLYGAFSGHLAGSVTGLLLLVVATWKLARARFPGVLRPVFTHSILKEIYSFAFPAFLAGLLVGPAYWWGNTLLARHSGFEHVGLFGVGFALAQLILLLPMSLSIPAVSFMSEANAAFSMERFSTLVSSNLRLIWALTLPLALGCALFSTLVVRLSFGSRYIEATHLVFWMSFAALWIAISSVIGAAIASLGRMWENLALSVAWLVIYSGLIWWWVPAHAEFGLAAAFFLSYLLFGFIVWQYSERWLQIRYQGTGGIFLLTVISLGISYGAGRLGAGWWRDAGAALLVLLLLGAEWIWVLDDHERRFVRKALSWPRRNS